MLAGPYCAAKYIQDSNYTYRYTWKYRSPGADVQYVEYVRRLRILLDEIYYRAPDPRRLGLIYNIARTSTDYLMGSI